ncbi:hypothetical protein CVT26_002406 [Gymnopilus dilepis]|uniref:F-box domain-containing protein n=1 Tax=Gymnopilus dilepis TaxID=231916 RepID=A0A409X525_9AGAR|nr:hypothetical protein CVT26_002406 [Gymnopilus dilepis]
MSNEAFDPLTLVADILLYSTDEESRLALKRLCKVDCDLWNYLFHRVYSTIHIRNNRQLLESFILFVSGRLVFPEKVQRLRVSVAGGKDTGLLQAALTYFLHSNALQFLELIGPAGSHFPMDLVSIISSITSTSAKPMTVVCDDLGPVHWGCIYHARHVELKRSYLLHDKSIPPRTWTLQSLTCSTDSGLETFDSMFLQQIELPSLSHLLVHVTPSGCDEEIVDHSLLAVLCNNTTIEEVVIIYTPNSAIPLRSVARTMQNLSEVLRSIASRHRGEISLNIDLRCSVRHAISLLSTLGDLEYFGTISASITTNHNSARVLLRHGYGLFVAGGANSSFRVDRREIRRSEKISTVYGYTVKDNETLIPASRNRSHHSICPWVSRPELCGFAVNWHDVMIPINNL